MTQMTLKWFKIPKSTKNHLQWFKITWNDSKWLKILCSTKIQKMAQNDPG